MQGSNTCFTHTIGKTLPAKDWKTSRGKSTIWDHNKAATTLREVRKAAWDLHKECAGCRDCTHESPCTVCKFWEDWKWTKWQFGRKKAKREKVNCELIRHAKSATGESSSTQQEGAEQGNQDGDIQDGATQGEHVEQADKEPSGQVSDEDGGPNQGSIHSEAASSYAASRHGSEQFYSVHSGSAESHKDPPKEESTVDSVKAVKITLNFKAKGETCRTTPIQKETY